MTIEELEQTNRDFKRRETATAGDFESQILALQSQLTSQKMAASQTKIDAEAQIEDLEKENERITQKFSEVSSQAERLTAELQESRSVGDRLRRENDGLSKTLEKRVQSMEEEASWVKSENNKKLQALNEQLEERNRRLKMKAAELEHSRLEFEEISKQLMEVSANAETEEKVGFYSCTCMSLAYGVTLFVTLPGSSARESIVPNGAGQEGTGDPI